MAHKQTAAKALGRSGAKVRASLARPKAAPSSGGKTTKRTAYPGGPGGPNAPRTPRRTAYPGGPGGPNDPRTAALKVHKEAQQQYLAKAVISFRKKRIRRERN